MDTLKCPKAKSAMNEFPVLFNWVSIPWQITSVFVCMLTTSTASLFIGTCKTLDDFRYVPNGQYASCMEGLPYIQMYHQMRSDQKSWGHTGDSTTQLYCVHILSSQGMIQGSRIQQRNILFHAEPLWCWACVDPVLQVNLFPPFLLALCVHRLGPCRLRWGFCNPKKWLPKPVIGDVLW